MGIFYEEVMYNRGNNSYNTEMQELQREREEYMEERKEYLVDLINSQAALNENNWWDDLGIKKEDLEDPQVVNRVIKDVRDHKYDPQISDIILNWLYGNLMLSVGTMLAGPIGLIVSGVIIYNKLTNRYTSFIKKTERGIKVLEKRLKTEEDPKMIKEYKERIEVLKQNKEKLEKASREINR